MNQPVFPDPAPESFRNANPSSGRRWLWVIVAAAMAARAWLLFGTRYVPGVNGGYYLVQARALMERGELGIPDLPLTFHLHAAVAWVIGGMGGLARAEAIVWAVKLCDAVLPPLVAWPVFGLVRRWATARGRGAGVPLAAAALVCCAWPWFRMVGDLQKNSLALVWLAGLVASLQGWLDAPTTRRAVSTLLWLALLSLTHVGVLGAALVMMAAVAGVAVFRHEPARRRQIVRWSAVAAALLVAAGALVLWRFDPARVHRLITAFTNPAKFAVDGRRMPALPGQEAAASLWLPALGFAAAVLPALVIAWRRRKEQPAADLALVAGLATMVLAITGPWFGSDKAVRFYLIGLIPAIAAGAFAVLHISSARVRRAVCGAAVAAGLGSAWPILRAGGNAILSDDAMAELQGLARQLPASGRTLVCAQHGVEWWSAWLLHTHIAQFAALRSSDWQDYEAIFRIEIKSGLRMPPGPGAPPPPGAFPHPRAASASGPPDFEPNGRPPREHGPAGADVRYDGEHVILSRMVSAP